MAKSSESHPGAVEWLAHIKALSEGIGPRGSTREGERRGSDYAKACFARLGLTPVWETFRSARSIFHPHLLGSLLLLAAFAVFPIGGPVTKGIAALLTVIVVISEVQELGFRGNLLRAIVPRGESQNVFATIPPKGQHDSDLVLVGHVDTQRTPLIFRTAGWVRVYEMFTTIAFAMFLWQAVDFALGFFSGWTWTWLAALPAVLCEILLAALCIEAECTPFTAGANDNASAAGLVLTLADEFLKQPLEHTRVFAVITGCEEVQHYGMIDFYRRHLPELVAPRAVVFEMMGCAGPSWSTSEGIIVPFRSDPQMLRMIEGLARAHPEWGAYPSKLSGGNSELADAARVGIPAITLWGIARDGVLPCWHQRGDTFDKIDAGVLDRAWQMTLALIKEIDRAGPPKKAV
jgi:hypothetical protein